MRQPARPIASLIAVWTVFAAPAMAEAGSFRIADDPGAIVLEYGHIDRRLAEQDPLPLVRIYGDGVVWVHYPVDTARAGDYELKLDRKELRRLIREIQLSGLLEFDRARTLKQRSAMQRGNGGLSGDTDTRLRIRLERYKGHELFDKSIVWTDVEADARAFPRLRPVQALSRLEKKLRAMIDRRPLSPVKLPLAQR